MSKLTTYADRLKFAMGFRGISQAELARRAKVTRSAVNQALSATSQWPKADNIFPMADALRFQARWLMTGHGPKTAEEAAENAVDVSMLDPHNKAAIRAARDALAGAPTTKAG